MIASVFIAVSIVFDVVILIELKKEVVSSCLNRNIYESGPYFFKRNFALYDLLYTADDKRRFYVFECRINRCQNNGYVYASKKYDG